MGFWVLCQPHLKDMGLTQNWGTMTLQVLATCHVLATLDLFLFIEWKSLCEAQILLGFHAIFMHDGE